MGDNSSTKVKQQGFEDTSLLDQQLSKVWKLGLKDSYLPAFPWTIGNSNLVLFLLYFLDFVLKSKVVFPTVILEDCPLPCHFSKFYPTTLIQVLFLRLLSSQSYTIYIMCKSNLYLEYIYGHKPIQMQYDSNHAFGHKIYQNQPTYVT